MLARYHTLVRPIEHLHGTGAITVSDLIQKHVKSLAISVLAGVIGYVSTQVLPGLEKHPEYGALIGAFSGYLVNAAKLGLQALAKSWGVDNADQGEA